MFRLWARQCLDNHTIKEAVIERDDDSLSRTRKVLTAVQEVCRSWDLAVPIWLETTIHDFKFHARARFYQDSFMEPIEFDYLEIRVIEE